MAKKQPAKEQDKFIVRLPPGMRDRIKYKADRAGMSMNEAIVWCLEREFPAPVTIEQRIEDLANMVSMMMDTDPMLGLVNLTVEVEEILDSIASKGGIHTDKKFRQMVRERLEYWRELEHDKLRNEFESPFDDAHHSEIEEPPESDPFKDAQQENGLKG